MSEASRIHNVLHLGSVTTTPISVGSDRAVGSTSLTGPFSSGIVMDTFFSGSIANNIAAVSVPAAAWLFGSGVLGFYSAAHRRLALQYLGSRRVL